MSKKRTQFDRRYGSVYNAPFAIDTLPLGTIKRAVWKDLMDGIPLGLIAKAQGVSLQYVEFVNEEWEDTKAWPEDEVGGRKVGRPSRSKA